MSTLPALVSYGCFSNSTLQTSVSASSSTLFPTDVNYFLKTSDPSECETHCIQASANLPVARGNGTLFFINGNKCSCFDFGAQTDGSSDAFQVAFGGSSPSTTSGALGSCTACSTNSALNCGNSYYGDTTSTTTSLANVYFYNTVQNSAPVSGSGGKQLTCASGFRTSVNNLRCIPQCSTVSGSNGLADGTNADLCVCSNPEFVYNTVLNQCVINRLTAFTSPYTASESYRGCLQNPTISAFTNVSTTLTTSSQCVNFCGSTKQGYAFIGYGSLTGTSTPQLICGCANSNSGSIVATAQCDAQCPGASSEHCGSLNNLAFDFYQIAATPNKLSPFTPDNNQNSTLTAVTTTYKGCVRNNGATLLSPSVAVNTTFNIRACQRACARDGYKTSLVTKASDCKCLAAEFNSNVGPNLGQNTLFTLRNAVCDAICPGNALASCGGANSYDVYSTNYQVLTTDPVTVPANLAKDVVFASPFNPSSNLDVSYAGCAEPTGYTAANVAFSTGLMTLEICAGACDAAPPPYSFFAVVGGSQCLCGTSFAASTTNPAPVCNVACIGNPSEICGSSSTAASIYNLQYVSPPFLATNNATASASYNLSVTSLGCYSVSGSNAASNGLFLNAKQDVATCQNSCLKAGYFFSGVTNGDTCLCASSLASTGVFSSDAPESKCTSKCVGNPAQSCGDSTSSYANVYKTEVVPTSTAPLVVDAVMQPYSFVADSGLWADDKTELLTAFCGSPALQSWTSATVMYPALLTPESCSKYCLKQYPKTALSAVFATAPTSFSTCACAPYSSLAAVVSAKGKCNAPCSGNNQLACGRQSDNTVATVSVLSHTGLAAAVSTSPYDASVNVTLKHDGCYALPANSSLQGPPDATLTTLTDSYACAADCFSHGFVYGFQQGDKCLCAKTVPSGATLSATPESDCNVVCKGNNQLTCGGAVYFDAVVYAQSYNTAPVNVTTPVASFRLASKTGHAANVAYAGCFAASSVNGETPLASDYSARKRATANQGIATSSLMTSKRCITACDQSNNLGAKQYSAAMLTSGDQCLCLTNVPSSSAAVTAANTCNLPCGGSATETCGDASNGQVYALNYETAVTMDTPYKGTDLKGTQYAGCYLGDTQNFQLNKGNAADMTVPYCVQACTASKFAYAALQRGNSCFCSASIANVTSAFRYPDSCKLPCSGNDQVSCGDLRNVNVYYTPLSTDTVIMNFTVPVRVSTPLAPYVFQKSVSASTSNNSTSGANATTAAITVTSGGCFSSDQAAFVQYRQAAVSANMTVQNCASLCANATTNTYAALTNSDTCMCGTSMPQSFSNGVSKCTYACGGDAKTSCGDNNYVNVYKLNSNLAPADASSSGASGSGFDSVPSATFSSGPSGSVSASGFVSASVSVSASQQPSVVPSGSVGVSASGSSLSSASVSSASSSSSVLSSTSTSTLSTSTSTSSSSSSSSAVTSTSTVSQPPAQSSASIVRAYSSGSVAWTYKSCWGEPLPHSLSNRALGSLLIKSGATVQSCLDAATARSFIYAGLEYGGECWGSNGRLVGGAIDDSYCNMPCTSSGSQYCGGDWTLSLYSTPAVPRNKAVVAVGNARFYYSSCWGEPRVGRALTNPINNNAGGTIESCLTLGLQAGYSLCGLEYGGECWCSKGSLYGGAIEQKYCDMPCKGDRTELCGGGNALSLYGRG